MIIHLLLSMFLGIHGFAIINPIHIVRERQHTTNDRKVLFSTDPIGGSKDEWANDLGANGGDPSFLPDGFEDEDNWYDGDAVEDDIDANQIMPSLSLLGMSQSVPSIVDRVADTDTDADTTDGDERPEESKESKFVWDGVEDENAYFD